MKSVPHFRAAHLRGAFSVACVSLLLGLSGCSSFTELKNNLSESMFGVDPANPPIELEPIKAAYETRLLWSAEIGNPSRYQYTPLVDDKLIYVPNSEGEILQLSSENGKINWRTALGEPVSSSVGIGGGLLFAGTKAGHLFAFNANGKKIWSAILSSEVQGQPRYFDGVVIVRTTDQHIYGIDAADGRRKWVYERPTPTLSLKTQAGIIVDGGAIYAGFPGGKIVAIRADNGKLLWEATVAQPKGVTEIERISDITSLPVVDGSVLYAVAYQGKLAAIDRIRGQQLWNRDISSYVGLSVDNNKIYLSHTLGSVYSLDSSNGKTFWRQGNLGYRMLTIPQVLGTVVAVGDLEGYVHLLSQDDGSFVGRGQFGTSPIISMLASGENQLLAFARDGHLYAIAIK